MTKTIGIESKGNIIFNYYLSDYVPNFFKGYHSYKVFLKDTKEFITVEEDKILDFIDRKVINITPFSIYKIDEVEKSVKKIHNINGTEIPYTKGLQTSFSVGENIIGINNLYNTNLFRKISYFESYITNEYEYSKAKKSKEYCEIVKNIIKNNDFLNIEEYNNYEYSLIESDIEDGVKLKLKIDIYRGKIEGNIYTNFSNKFYNKLLNLKTNSFSELIENDTDLKEIYKKVSDTIYNSKEQITGKINKIVLTKTSGINKLLSDFLENEVLVKEKSIINKVINIKGVLENFSNEESFNTNEGNFFENINKSLNFNDFNSYDKIIINKKDDSEKFNGEELFEILYQKQKNVIPDINKHLNDIEKEELLKGKIQTVSIINERDLDIELPKNLIDIINKDIDNVEINLQNLRSNLVKKSKQNEIKLEFNKLELSNSDDTADYITQKERSKSFAESIQIIFEIEKLYKTIKDYQLNYTNLNEFKEKVSIYKNYSEELSRKYSGEGGLLVTKDIIKSLLTYITLNQDINENEEYYIKSFLYSNTGNLLNYLHENIDQKKDSDKVNSIQLYMKQLSVFDYNSESTYKLSLILNNILDGLEKNKIDDDLLNGYKMTNEEGNGSYYTPNEFGYFLKPFVENLSYINQVNIVDVSCGKGTLLNYLNGKNIKKVGNDINPLSIKVLKLTQGFNYNSILNSNDIGDIINTLNSSDLIITNNSALSFLDYDIKADFLLSNPPYINSIIGSKEKENILKENKVRNISNGKVNMVEFTYKGLINNLKLGGIGMLISSARGISKTEQKIRIDSDNYLVPLYRIGISGKPFKKEGVLLAPVSISGDDIYIYNEGELKKQEEAAEFFVTIYTKLNKNYQDDFSNTAPTIIVNYKDIKEFNDFVSENFENNNVLSNYNNYFNVFRKLKLDEINKFSKISSNYTEQNLNEENFQKIISKIENITDFLIEKNKEGKSVNKIKYLKTNNLINEQVEEIFDKFRYIDDRLIPLTKESLRNYINEVSLKSTLKKEYGLDYNGYSFNLTKDTKLKQVGTKYFYNDRDFSNLLKYPFPYSLHTVPLNAYSEILSKYILSSGVTENFKIQKINDFKNVVNQFISYNSEETVKVINKIGDLNISNTTKVAKFLIDERKNIVSSDAQLINDLIERIVKVETTCNKENLKDLLYYLRQNDNNFESTLLNGRGLNGTLKSFSKGYTLKIKDNSLFEQSVTSVYKLTQFVKKYQNDNKLNCFNSIVNGTHKSSIYLLNELGDILIDEFDKGNNYFNLISGFKKHNSSLLRDYSGIEKYTNFKKIQKIDSFFNEISDIEEQMNNLNTEIDFVIKNAIKDISTKDFISEIKANLQGTGKYSISNNELVEVVKDQLLKYKHLDVNKIDSIEVSLNSLKSKVDNIRNEEIKILYLKNINAINNNFDTIKNIYEHSINLSGDECSQSRYYIRDNNELELIKDIKVIIGTDLDNTLEINKINVKSIKNLFYNSLDTDTDIIEADFNKDNIFKDLLKQKKEQKTNNRKNFKSINRFYLGKKLNKELSVSFDEKNMLLDVYKNSVADSFITKYKDEVSYIDNIINYFKEKELLVQGDIKKEDREEITNFLNYSKFLTINTNDYEKIIILDYIKTYGESTNDIDKYIEDHIEKFHNVKKENFKTHILTKNIDFDIYGKDMADSIVMSLGVKSNYSNLYSNIFLDLESNLLLNNEKESIFKPEFIAFQHYLDNVSPYQEVINLSTRYAELLNQKSILRKKDPILKDLLEIDNISDYVDINEFNDLNDEDLLEIIKNDSLLKKDTIKCINSEIDEIEIKLQDVDELIKDNKSKLLPTFVQSKALFKFQNTLDYTKNFVKLLNQSEVGTGKTFTMPFYESLLDDKFKSRQKSFKLFITEANLVSNTTKSLIENGKSPNDILEGKISNLDDIKKIINFVRKGGTNLILSNASLYNFDTLNIRILSKFLKKNVGNIYFYSDEATFLKNTESNSYSGYKTLLSELKKTKKLRLQNYLTATPVNNDNGDFLYLLELFNKKDILKYIKNCKLSDNGKVDLYKIMNNIDNLKIGKKEKRLVEDKKEIYYYIPNILYLLEFVRTGDEHSLSSFNLNGTIEIENKFNSKEKDYITLKKYYEELGITIKEISYEDYKNPKYISENPLCFNSKTEELAYELIELFKNINIVNFDRNLNSIGLKGNTSKLYKTYYSLTPSLIESLIIENFLDEIGRVQKFKKISNAIGMVKNNRLYSIDNIFSNEGINIFNNIVLEVGSLINIEMEKGSYSVKRKIKKGYKEYEESISYNTFKAKKEDLVNGFNTIDGDNYIFGNKFLDSILMNIDIISYSNYKNKVKEIDNLLEKGVNSKIIKREEKEKEKYLINIYTILGNFIDESIKINVTKSDLTEKIINKLSGDEEINTVKGTYIEEPEKLLFEIEPYIKNKSIGFNQIQKIYENLEKNTNGGVMSERSYIIQLLEDFNTPLGAIFIEKVIRNIALEGKERGVEVSINDNDILKIKEYIITNGNTLSGTLNELACNNSKNNVNTFITTNYVNTVLNLRREINKNTKNVFMITGKDVKTSKEKLKIINDFDKLDGFGKTLVATSKSVEKGLSIFNALKGYTTIGDENAGALTQRIGRFRTLMSKQLSNLDNFYEKVENGDVNVKDKEKTSYLNNIKKLKENKKEFFILSNKLSESMLQTSEVKNILLQKVNSTSMFNGIIDFNDSYFGNTGNTFSINNVISGIKSIIDEEKKKFYEKLSEFNKTIDGELLYFEINKNIKNNIKRNTENIKKIEGIKIDNIDGLKTNAFTIK